MYLAFQSIVQHFDFTEANEVIKSDRFKRKFYIFPKGIILMREQISQSLSL